MTRGGQGDAASQTHIFLHIERTAGTTLHRILGRQYPADLIWKFDETHGFEDFTALSEAGKAEIRLFAGHMVYGLHKQIPRPATYFTLLRDPIERAVSGYHYARSTPGHRLHAAIHREDLTLAQVLERGLDPMLDNRQTRMLSGGWYVTEFGRIGQEALQTAKENLETGFAVVGLTERFDESLLLLKRAFGWGNLFYVRRNVGVGRPRQKDLSPESLALVRRYNRLDRELYEYAAERFERQVQEAGTGFRVRLAAFRAANRLFPAALSLYRVLRRVSVRSWASRLSIPFDDPGHPPSDRLP